MRHAVRSSHSSKYRLGRAHAPGRRLGKVYRAFKTLPKEGKKDGKSRWMTLKEVGEELGMDARSVKQHVLPDLKHKRVSARIVRICRKSFEAWEAREDDGPTSSSSGKVKPGF